MNIFNNVLKCARNQCLAEYFRINFDALEGQGPFYRRHLPGTPDKAIREGKQVIGIYKPTTFRKFIAKKKGLQGN